MGNRVSSGKSRSVPRPNKPIELSYLRVFELEKDRFYVDSVPEADVDDYTVNVEWVVNYPIVGLWYKKQVLCGYDEEMVDDEVKALAYSKGVDKVRGGSYSDLALSSVQLRELIGEGVFRRPYDPHLSEQSLGEVSDVASSVDTPVHQTTFSVSLSGLRSTTLDASPRSATQSSPKSTTLSSTQSSPKGVSPQSSPKSSTPRSTTLGTSPRSTTLGSTQSSPKSSTPRSTTLGSTQSNPKSSTPRSTTLGSTQSSPKGTSPRSTTLGPTQSSPKGSSPRSTTLGPTQSSPKGSSPRRTFPVITPRSPRCGRCSRSGHSRESCYMCDDTDGYYLCTHSNDKEVLCKNITSLYGGRCKKHTVLY